MLIVCHPNLGGSNEQNGIATSAMVTGSVASITLALAAMAKVEGRGGVNQQTPPVIGCMATTRKDAGSRFCGYRGRLCHASYSAFFGWYPLMLG
jgi:hypothetical protein